MAALTNEELIDTFEQSSSTLSGKQITQFLIANGSYNSVHQIVAQLERAGVSAANAKAAVNAPGPSELQKILQAASGFVYVPGGVTDALTTGAGETAGAAAESTAAGAGAGATGSSLLQGALSKYGQDAVWIPVIAWLTTESNWVRVLEFVGGAVMIGIAMRSLADS